MSRAPGRLDVMGGIADYSGSLVLQVMSISSATPADFRNCMLFLNIMFVISDAN